MMSDEEKQALLEELVQYGRRPEMQPGDVTLSELAEQLGVGRGTAQKRMKGLIEAGEVQELIVRLPNGHDGIVYRRV